MFCHNCGSKPPANSRFCPYCGASIIPVKAPNVIRLRCEDCNGIMDIDESREVVSCPYCGSKKVVLESDDVKIERIRNETKKEQSHAYRDVETSKAHRDIEVSKDKKEMQKVDYKHEIIMTFLAAAVLLLMMYLMYSVVR